MPDPFDHQSKGLDAPGDLHFDAGVQASDTIDLAIVPRSLRADVAGVVSVRDKAGTVVPYTLQAGEVLTFRGVRIMSTGTDAALKAAGKLIGWY